MTKLIELQSNSRATIVLNDKDEIVFSIGDNERLRITNDHFVIADNDVLHNPMELYEEMLKFFKHINELILNKEVIE